MLDETIFYTFTWAWITLAFIIFLINLKIKAPYGRHSKTTWGPMIDNRLGWIIMELPALLTCPVFFFLGDGEKLTVTYIFVGIWIMHYFNRTFVFPFRIRTNGKKMPLVVTSSAIFFNLVNGFVCGYFLGNFAEYSNDWMMSIPFIIGIVIFFIGFFINNQSDTILINLRKPGEVGYKIPKGGLFKYVSCPNLFGEIVEWIGFGIMCFALPTFTFTIWTMANLIPRALAHHQWYQEKFEDYPKERKAVFPWII